MAPCSSCRILAEALRSGVVTAAFLTPPTITPPSLAPQAILNMVCSTQQALFKPFTLQYFLRSSIGLSYVTALKWEKKSSDEDKKVDPQLISHMWIKMGMTSVLPVWAGAAGAQSDTSQFVTVHPLPWWVQENPIRALGVFGTHIPGQVPLQWGNGSQPPAGWASGGLDQCRWCSKSWWGGEKKPTRANRNHSQANDPGK